jgi:hypothetical protein
VAAARTTRAEKKCIVKTREKVRGRVEVWKARDRGLDEEKNPAARLPFKLRDGRGNMDNEAASCD